MGINPSHKHCKSSGAAANPAVGGGENHILNLWMKRNTRGRKRRRRRGCTRGMRQCDAARHAGGERKRDAAWLGGVDREGVEQGGRWQSASRRS
jgi:hypothetical protein